MVDSVLEVQNIKLPDSGGVTSSTAITLDASGNVTLAGTANNIGTVTSGTFNGTIGNSVTFDDSFAYYTMADTAGTGSSSTVQFNSVTKVLEDLDFYSSSFTSNTLTVTIAQAGYYKISNSFYNYGNANIITYRYYALITGTATKYGLNPSLPVPEKISFDSGSGQYIGDTHNNIELTFLIYATAGQTIGIEPHFIYTLTTGTYYYGSNIEIKKVK